MYFTTIKAHFRKKLSKQKRETTSFRNLQIVLEQNAAYTSCYSFFDFLFLLDGLQNNNLIM